ncbi:hypothetical protein GGTG_03868 [Gaeumannomyces tritici R3-111a-1]|uniref:Uncharacterized protein n=1 Tax=Gaeumannomyces tritici (strain R3-111a-1) TaxID=644352 RepID=J3NRG4_GAET3|nr:hypothetical protein GGTG_03868 [Gaeumannomyces tritici R3-111a-1]EJT78770.1 hypothetical protein GGTG_03868 [Gaeumannomyces tritici R3-111a-1]
MEICKIIGGGTVIGYAANGDPCPPARRRVLAMTKEAEGGQAASLCGRLAPPDSRYPRQVPTVGTCRLPQETPAGTSTAPCRRQHARYRPSACFLIADQAMPPAHPPFCRPGPRLPLSSAPQITPAPSPSYEAFERRGVAGRVDGQPGWARLAACVCVCAMCVCARACPAAGDLSVQPLLPLPLVDRLACLLPAGSVSPKNGAQASRQEHPFFGESDGPRMALARAVPGHRHAGRLFTPPPHPAPVHCVPFAQHTRDYGSAALTRLARALHGGQIAQAPCHHLAWCSSLPSPGLFVFSPACRRLSFPLAFRSPSPPSAILNADALPATTVFRRRRSSRVTPFELESERFQNLSTRAWKVLRRSRNPPESPHAKPTPYEAADANTDEPSHLLKDTLPGSLPFRRFLVESLF